MRFLTLLIACKINMGNLKRAVNTCICLFIGASLKRLEAQVIASALSIQH
jgi:hypothetical protein